MQKLLTYSIKTMEGEENTLSELIQEIELIPYDVSSMDSDYLKLVLRQVADAAYCIGVRDADEMWNPMNKGTK